MISIKKEGIYLRAIVRNPYDEENPDRYFTVEDTYYNNKKDFRQDLKGNGYVVRSIADRRDDYLIDNTNDFAYVSQLVKKLKDYESWIARDKENGKEKSVWEDSFNSLSELYSKVMSIPLD